MATLRAIVGNPSTTSSNCQHHPSSARSSGDVTCLNTSIFLVSDSLDISTSKPPDVGPSYGSLLWRHRFLTTSYCMLFWSFGMGVAFLGPTLLDLGCQTGSVFSTISWVFFSQALFILVGSASGGWISTKFPKHRVLLVSVSFMAVTLSIIPFCKSLGPLALTLAIMGFFMGIIDTLANLSMIELYGEYVGPFLQALHFFYGLGAFLAPMVVKPFLSNFDCTPLIDPRVGSSPPTESSVLENPSIVSLDAAVRNSRVQYSFWIMASMQIPVVFLLSLVVIRERIMAKEKSSQETIEMDSKQEPTTLIGESERTSSATWHQIVLLTGLTAMLLFLVDGLQAIYASYVYSFAIKMFETIHSSEAAYLSATFWGTFALGRLLSIAISAFVKPQIMLLGNIGGCLSGVILLLMVPQSRLAIYIGTALIGLFLSSVYPTSLSLVKAYIDVTPSITTVCVVSAAAGEMFMPVIVGHEFGSLGPKSFLITCLVLAGAGFLVYFLFILLGSRVKNSEGDGVWPRFSVFSRRKADLKYSRENYLHEGKSLVSLNFYGLIRADL